MPFFEFEIIVNDSIIIVIFSFEFVFELYIMGLDILIDVMIR